MHSSKCHYNVCAPHDINNYHFLCFLSTHANRQVVDHISVTVCVFFVCTVTDFSAEDKASSVKFCRVVHWCQRQGISHFGKLCSPSSQKSDELAIT